MDVEHISEVLEEMVGGIVELFGNKPGEKKVFTKRSSPKKKLNPKTKEYLTRSEMEKMTGKKIKGPRHPKWNPREAMRKGKVKKIREDRDELLEARNRKLKTEMKLKNGDVIPKGTAVEVKFLGERHPKGARGVHIKTSWKGKSGRDYMREPILMSIMKLHTKVSGFGKPPNEKKMFKMISDGVATTPTGKRIEPDGWAPDGSPSWMLAMGLI